jgi:hypothetical protein
MEIINRTGSPYLKINWLDPRKNSQDIRKLQDIMSIWIEHAKAKQLYCKSELEKEIFKESISICKCIEVFTRFELSLDDYFFITVNGNLSKEIHAVGVIKLNDRELKISLLATHPRNIRSAVNECEFQKITGAATKIIHFVKQIQIEKNIEKIELKSVETAAKFYEKMGFEQKETIIKAGKSLIKFEYLPPYFKKEPSKAA